MNVHRLALAGMVLSIVGMTMALMPRTAPVPVKTAEVCLTVQGIVDKNPDLHFFGPGWRVSGSSHLGTSQHLMLGQQPSVILHDHIRGLEFDYILAQMTNKGPVYFFFLGSCVAKAVKLEGNVEA